MRELKKKEKRKREGGRKKTERKKEGKKRKTSIIFKKS